jgi:predicted dehydrogenase
MDQKNILRVGVIGCGRIGSLWDEALSESEVNTSQPKTHALAYLQNKVTKLVALCDTDTKRAEAAAKKWKVDFFTDQVSAFLNQDLDIISVCTPTDNRLEVLKSIVAKSSDSVLLLEKPLAKDLQEAKLVKEILTALKKPAIVNYSRRFAPGIQNLKSQIAQGLWGTLQAGTAYYGNGFTNNGSHMLDLISYLLGEPKSSEVQKIVFDDRVTHDSTLSATLTLNNSAQIQIHGLDHRNFTVFELDLVFTLGRVRLTERGMVIQSQKIIDDPVYSGFRILGEPQVVSSQYELALSNAVDEAAQLQLGTIKRPSCSVDDALNVMENIENIRRSSK